MEIKGLSLTEFRSCVHEVSTRRYAGNLRMGDNAYDRADGKNGTHYCTARLRVLDSRGPGSRTSWTGRHGPYACWHACRDVLHEVFRRYPNAVIRAGHGWRVTYRGLAGFLADYPETAHVNIGSVIDPVTMPELCECLEIRRRTRPVLISGEVFVLGEEVPAFQREHLTEAVSAFPREQPSYTDDEFAAAEEQRLLLGADNSPHYVSGAVRNASRAYAASAELLGEGDKAADPWVFGPEYGPWRLSAPTSNERTE